uniref:Integrase catalytic domain-containing protein n=1 Tax=Tanacetum cinerariifolium TaxID=118510 RepID=A0A6L2MGS3_TANCI|nr:hypothetical protein [Tanacetum cinerariifolium]
MAKQVELNKSKNRVTSQRNDRTVWNNVQIMNHTNKFVPTAILTKTGIFPVNAVRQNFFSQAASTSTVRKVNTARKMVNEIRPRDNLFKSHAPIRRPFNRTTAPKANFTNHKVNNVGNKTVSAVGGNRDNPHQTLKGKGIIDSRCSRHMIGNKAYLVEYQDFNGGHVAFGGSKGTITGKGKIKTGKLDFVDVYFMKELQHFNLFSVSQMCNKKNKVLFTDTECLVLSLDFKLPDENQGNPQHALKDNGVIDSGCSRHMTGNMSYLSDFKEHNDGYVAFEGNLKGGKIFEKGKIKTGKLDFDDVYFVKELKFNLFSVLQMCDKKNSFLFTDTECLVLSPEFKLPDENQVLLRVPRFTWVFFLATKDETSPILKTFITGLENQLSLKVKVIRSDNGNQFKNHDLNQFCRMEGIKREFSIPRTPQQTGIAERKNRTFIEAARTMLVDSFLPILFWAEAVNTACYVQNRVLVTKPQNKTPYELLHGRTPSIGFMRPFGCLVTILNTLDSLGKFDGKVDEGFLVGYSVSSKAFRVFNSKTRIVQETLHVNFLENKPNVIEKAREKSDQQYVLFLVRCSGFTNLQNTNGDAAFGEKEHEFDEKKHESEVNVSPSSSAQSKKHDDKTKKEAKGKSLVESLTGYRNLSAEFEDFSDNSINEDNAACTLVLAVGKISLNNTNTFSAAGPSNAVVSPTHGKFSCIYTFKLPDDPDMPKLEDITYSDNEDDVGAEANFNNLETSITFSPIPTTRVHKDHPVAQIIGDLSSATYTRKPNRVHQAHKDPSWIEAMQEELLQFKMQKVWVLVDLPYGKRAIATKWVFRNKKDERGIVGHRQEERVDYDEVFAPVARLEAIRIFLAFASYMGFIVYQMDVKSAFLYVKIDEEVYVSQPLGFIDPRFLKKVYKVLKALYGLHQDPRVWYATLSTFLVKSGYRRGIIDKTLFIKKDQKDIMLVQVYVDDIIFGSTKKSWCDKFKALMKNRFQMSSMGELTFFLGLQVKHKKDGIFISKDKYVAEILKKFYFMSVKTASTPIETKKPLVKDAKAADVDVHIYISMIGSLMYLTACRPDIMYLKGQPKLGLWCPRESAFDLEAYSDSDYAGANLDRKSTTGGFQFLGRSLITWQCKKQTIVATYTTEAEYVAAANCRGQGRSTDKIKLLNAEAEGVSAAGETLSTATLVVSIEAKMDMRKFFKCWFHHHTTNGHQFTMSNRHQELASPKANGSWGGLLGIMNFYNLVLLIHLNATLGVLVDAAEFCLAALTSTCPDLVATAVGTKFLFGREWVILEKF